jgi:hypothetical protein
MDTKQVVNETSAKIAAKNDEFRRSMELYSNERCLGNGARSMISSSR